MGRRKICVRFLCSTIHVFAPDIPIDAFKNSHLYVLYSVCTSYKVCLSFCSCAACTAHVFDPYKWHNLRYVMISPDMSILQTPATKLVSDPGLGNPPVDLVIDGNDNSGNCYSNIYQLPV